MSYVLPRTIIVPLERVWPEILEDSLRHLGHGKALWGYSLFSTRDIEIGDVGYFSDGKFELLWNITEPRDKQKVPDDFEQMMFDKHADVDISEGVLTPNKLYVSPKVTIKKEIPEEGDGPRKYTLDCRDKESAVIVSFDPPTKTRLKRAVHARWRSYMRKHLQSWYEFMHKGWFAFGMDWLVLITGTVKTLRWASATFKGVGKHEFNVWPSKGIDASVSSPAPLSGHARSGPGPGNWVHRVIRATDPELARHLPD